MAALHAGLLLISNATPCSFSIQIIIILYISTRTFDNYSHNECGSDDIYSELVRYLLTTTKLL